MKLIVGIDGADPAGAELDSLYRTLLKDPAVRPAKVTPCEHAPDDAMGPVTEALVIAFGAGGVGVTVIQAISNWLNTRRREISVKIGMPDAPIEVSMTGARDVGEIVTLLRAAGQMSEASRQDATEGS